MDREVLEFLESLGVLRERTTKLMISVVDLSKVSDLSRQRFLCKYSELLDGLNDK